MPVFYIRKIKYKNIGGKLRRVGKYTKVVAPSKISALKKLEGQNSEVKSVPRNYALKKYKKKLKKKV